MPNTSTRLSLQEPIGADAVSELRLAITNLATTLDNSAIWAAPTTLAGRPAASTYKAGTVHRTTDSGVVALSDGTTWHVLAADNQGPPVGAVQQYAGSADPVDPDGTTRWFICDGRGLSTTTYSTLYTAIGYTHGGSAGTMNIPDCRGRTAIGASSGSGANNTDGTNVNGPTSTTLSARVLGKRIGEENHTLTLAELAAHAHNITDSGHAHTVQAMMGWSAGGTYGYWPSWNGGYTYLFGGNYFNSSPATTGISVNNAGSDTKHNTVMPSVVLNFIIRVL